MRAISKSNFDCLVKKKKKESKTEKKIVLQSQLACITALLFHLVTTKIQALVILWHQILQPLIK